MRRLLVVSSTGGSLLRKAFTVSRFREAVVAVVSDREAGALAVADGFGVPTKNFQQSQRRPFFESLANYADANRADYIISASYSKIFDASFLARFPNRIFNCHHSMLPAFIGPRGFARALAHGVRLIGNTVHLVDERVDEGWPLMQSVLPVPYDVAPTRLRHQLFVHEVTMLVQAGLWLAEGRVRVDAEGVRVDGAVFDAGSFSPALDAKELDDFDIPYPGDTFMLSHPSYVRGLRPVGCESLRIDGPLLR